MMTSSVVVDYSIAQQTFSPQQVFFNAKTQKNFKSSASTDGVAAAANT